MGLPGFRVKPLSPADVRAAARIVALLADVPTAIGRVVPAGCEAYARIFPRAHDGVAPRRWQELLGRRPRARDRWEDVEAAVGMGVDPSSESGSLDADTSTGLAQALGHVTPVDRVTVALWEGYADAEPYRDSPAIVLPPGRHMLLLSATWSELANAVGGRSEGRRATRYWPDDSSWMLGGDIYSRTVVIGGTATAVAAVLAHSELEATPLRGEDGLEDLD